MKKTVLEVECSRCHRKEYVPAPQVEAEAVPAVVILVAGKEVAKFEDLCEPCKQAVAGYIEALTKPMFKQSPNRKKKDKTDPPAAEANGAGAKEKGVHQHPPPTVVTRPR